MPYIASTQRTELPSEDNSDLALILSANPDGTLTALIATRVNGVVEGFCSPIITLKAENLVTAGLVLADDKQFEALVRRIQGLQQPGPLPLLKEHAVRGDTSHCTQCAAQIEYIGPYWRHVAGNPRHIATPPGSSAERGPDCHEND